MKQLHLFPGILCALFLASTTPTRAAAPAAPQYVNVSWLDNQNQFLVRWFSVTDATSYNVYRYDTNTSAWTAVATNLSFESWNVPSFRHSASPESGEGIYSVTAVNGDGESSSTSASVVPGSGLSTFTCYFDYWPRGYTFIQSQCQGSWEAGTMGMMEVALDGTNFTHGVWSTNFQITHQLRVTNLLSGTRYYTRLTQIDTNGSGFSEVYPWYGVSTLPLTPINVLEDRVNDIEIGDFTWNEDLAITPAQILIPPAHGTLVQEGWKYMWKYTPDPNFFGTDSVTILDNPAGPPVTLTLNVQDVNDPPVPQPFTVYMAEDSTIVITPVVHDTENDPYGVYEWTYPANGYLERVGHVTNFIYTPYQNFVGTDQFEFLALDPYDWYGTVLGTIIVTNVNDAPVTFDQYFMTVEDTPVTFTLDANDVDGDTLTVEIVDPPSNGSVTNTGMTVTYTPNLNYSDFELFSFRVSDGQTNSEVRWVGIQVMQVNDPPVAHPVTVTTAEDTTAFFEFSWSDPENGVSSYEVVDPPQHGSSSGNVYTPAPNYFGTDTFTYRVFDGEFWSAPATVTITVTPVNDLPRPDDKELTVDEDQSLAITLTGSDVDGDTLTFRISSPPLHGTFTNGVYTPPANFNGWDTFRYDAWDGTTYGDSAGVYVTVYGVNDPPTADNKSVSVNEDGSVNIALTGSDVDGESLTFAVVNPPQHGQFVNGVYTPAANYFGSDGFTYKANDSQLDSAPATVSISVVSANDEPPAPEFVKLAWVNSDHFLIRWAPVANATGYNVYRYDTNTSDWLQIATNLQVLSVPLFRDPSPAVSASYAVRALNSEGAGAAATASLTPDPAAPWPSISGMPDTWRIARSYVQPRFSQSLTAGTDGMAEIRIVGSNEFFAVSWVTNPDQMHILEFTNLASWVPYEVQFTAVADSGIGTTTGIPYYWFYIEPPSATLQEDTSVTIDLGTPTAEVLQILTSPSHGTLTPLENGRYTTYTPAPNFFGTDTFQILDHTSGPPVSVTVTVQNVNDAPQAQPITIYVAEDSQAMFPPVVFDIENDPYVFTVSIPAAHGDSFGYQFTHLMYIPYPDFFGQDEFWYYAVDEAEGPSARVTVIVTNVNDAPVANDQSVTLSEDTSSTFTLNASDVDGDPLSIEFGTAPSHGAITNTGLSVTYTPNPNYNGTDSFTYRVSDGQVASEWKTVDLLVNPANDAPTADSKSASTSEDQSVVIALTGSDIDGDSLNFIVVTPPQHGEFAGGVYTPAANYNGPDSFTYKANDGSLDSAPATVSITITPVNDVPVADSKSVSTAEDQSLTVTLTGSDVDGDTLTFTVIDAPAHGTFVNGVYTPAANYNGPDSFSYKANDGQVDSALATATITVTAVNDAPVANGQSVSTAYNTAVNIVLTGSDLEGSALTFTVVSLPANGTLTGTGANRTFTPNIGWYGTTSFTFVANDGGLDSVAATVTITVASAGSVPAAPSSLAATVISRTQINLAWNDNSANEDGFKIERATSSSGPWTQIATVGPDVRNYSSTGLTRNTRYYYRVRAYNVLGNSAYSNTVSARTLN
jgi:hypothetical protein